MPDAEIRMEKLSDIARCKIKNIVKQSQDYMKIGRAVKTILSGACKDARRTPGQSYGKSRRQKSYEKTNWAVAEFDGFHKIITCCNWKKHLDY